MNNPLIAPTQDSTTAYSGISLLESANDLKSAIESGDWASVALGAVGTALDALSAAMDPFGAILAAGVGWLLEHVGPLREALDGLTGNADQIQAQSETWRNVATELGNVGQDLQDAVKVDLGSWTGPASDSYRQRAQDIAALLESTQKACEGASAGVQTAGEVVAAVRTLVHDIISELIGHLISWALQVLFTLGIGLAWVVPQVVEAVAKTASKIADFTTRLVKALHALMPLLKKAGTLFEDSAKALKGLKGGKISPPAKSQPIDVSPKVPPTKIPPRGDDATSLSADQAPQAAKGDDSTTASSANAPNDDSTTTSSANTPNADHTTPPKADEPAPAKTGTPPPMTESAPPRADIPPTPDATTKSTSSPPKDNPRDRVVPSDKKVCVSDPVDIATGEVVMTQVDLTLPGEAGDLVLSRTHLSSYRAGRWFGRSWASTLDQRLELRPEQIQYYAEDGMVLVYPLPGDGAAVLPLEGPRHPLRWTPQGYRLSAGSRDLVFAEVPGGGRRVLPLTMIEQDGSRTTIEHSPTGAPWLLRRDDGTEIHIAAGIDRIVALGVPGAAPVVRFGYNRLGQLTQIADFAGHQTTLDYNVDERIVGWQDRTGTWYRYVYDADGRCVRSVGADRYLNGTFTYDTTARTTRHTDALGHSWTYRLNETGQLVERTDPLGHTRRYSWSRYDELLAQVDELGRLTSYGYEDGALTTVTRPDGSVVRLTSTASGEVVLESGVDEAKARAVISASDPYADLPGVSTRLRVEGPADTLSDEPVITASARPGDRDPFGRPRLVHTASGGEIRLGWTAEGRRAWRIGPHGDREGWQYDAEGHVVEHRDAAGRTTRRKYGPFGLLTEEFDPSGARTGYSYDHELRLVAVTSPQGLTWRYTYDPAGRIIEEVDYDGRRMTYAYDEAGQLRRMTNGLGEVTEYHYDLLGNVIERRTATGVTGYAYDELGRLTYAVNADSVLNIVRDERGRVLEETVNGVGVHWHYDVTSLHRTTVSGVDTEWHYDVRGVPVSLRAAGHEISFEHDEAGRETGRAVDGTVVLRQAFDAEDRLAEQVITGLGRRTYTYTPDGRLAAIDDALPIRFGFDQAGRVSEVHAPEGVEWFAYDATGTLASAVTASSAGLRVYRDNTLLVAAGTQYLHDPQGRVTSRVQSTPTGPEEWRFVWDELDRMIAVVAPDDSFWTYLYDPLGRRFAKRRWVLDDHGEPKRTAETWFVWNGTDLVEQIELNDDGTSRVLTWERHPGDSKPVAQIEQSGPRYGLRFHTAVTSPAGTPTELIGEGGTVDWQARMGFWGELLPTTTGTAPMPLAFPGQYRDDETGLHYNVYRYYDPRTGRYLSQDPLGLTAAPDPVGYVAQPVLQGDPLGLVSPCGKTGAPQPPERPAGGDDAGKLDPPGKKPDTLADFRGKDGKVRPADMTDEQYAKFAKKWDELMAPGKDKSWFWSGGHVKDADAINPQKYLGSIENPAGAMAKKHGGNTLEGILADNKIEMPGFTDNNPNAGKVWTDASKALARGAEGEVHVALPNTPGKTTGWPGHGDLISGRRTENVLDMDEFPILRHNPNVTKVWAHDVDYPDALPVVIWNKEIR
ncbi:DUF6531 domain-containing protein [Amycolatopsis sp. NPDC005232]|uniref:DUF6531 domain-containing protein n=1 Tax=Amycolatopsis sp. NPDC005232 TaxID=3157027 RepID=UPI0033A9A463